VCFDPVSNVVYVCSATTSNQVRIYDSNYNLIRQWGTNTLSSPNGIAVGSNGLVYLADTGNYRIQVFNAQGNFVRQWGQSGSGSGQFNGIYDIAVGPDGSVYATDYTNARVQQFAANGNYLTAYSGTSWYTKTIAMAPDGLIYVWGGNSALWAPRLFPAQLGNEFFLSVGAPDWLVGAAFSPRGNLLYVLSQTQIRVFRRIYRTPGTIPPNAVPLPVVLNVAQRPSTTWVDIDFSVIDADDATVQAGVVACLNGRQDLLAIIPMLTFTNGTDVMLPTNVATGVKYHLTWNAGADWLTSYGNVKINVLAKDARGLLDAHYITIPSNATYTTPLTISQSPYTQTDFLGVWTWLVATANPNIRLTTGSVYAVNSAYGVYSNALATTATNTLTTTTTTDGRTFIFAMMTSNMVSTVYSNWIIREATTGEVNSAKLGTTGKITQWTPRVQINGLPQLVNEYSFDTGSFNTNNPSWYPTNDWWTVLVPR